jgi:hypothetical protein
MRARKELQGSCLRRAYTVPRRVRLGSGTSGSNPLCSSGESANPRSRYVAEALRHISPERVYTHAAQEPDNGSQPRPVGG